MRKVGLKIKPFNSSATKVIIQDGVDKGIFSPVDVDDTDLLRILYEEFKEYDNVVSMYNRVYTVVISKEN